MAQVDITVNGKTYRIACEDGQEKRLTELAAMVDAHVKDLVDQVGQVGDTRLLVMASLLIADELIDLRDAANEVEEVDEVDEEFSPNEVEDLTIAIEGLAERIERIAGRLDGP
ncbi:MAG: cell division protein ZapA [Alphaproteobacteria bacterium]|nr:cell division protein ZapA [Alphaproteobacteria bacterium]